MTIPRRNFLRLTAGALALPAVPRAALAQASRTVRVVVPYPPGGGIDVAARILADEIGRSQGVTVVVENRPGAGTIVGTEAVARAVPDGSTILIATNTFVVTPHLRQLNYDAMTSFVPICDLMQTPTVFAVGSASPYRTLADLIAAARAQPGRLTLASVPGTLLQISFEMLQRAAGIDMVFVPYPGTVPAATALLGGHVDVAFTDYPTVAEQLKAGTLRALATGAPTRVELLPGVPTVEESGFRGYEAVFWYGLFAPAKTSAEATTRLGDLFIAAMREPAVKAKLHAQGLDPVLTCGADFAAYVRKEFDQYGEVIRAANIKAE